MFVLPCPNGVDIANVQSGQKITDICLTDLVTL